MRVPYVAFSCHCWNCLFYDFIWAPVQVLVNTFGFIQPMVRISRTFPKTEPETTW